MPGLGASVVLGSGLEMRVGKNTDVLQQLHGPIDRGCVDSRDSSPDALGNRGGGDMAFARHDLGNDDPPLRRHSQPAVPQQLEDGFFAAWHSAILWARVTRSRLLFEAAPWIQDGPRREGGLEADGSPPLHAEDSCPHRQPPNPTALG